MALVTRPIKLRRSTRLAREGSFLAGAGRDERLPVGILAADGRRHRAYLRLADSRFPASFWSGAYRGVKMELWGFKVDHYRCDAGSGGRVRVRRATAGESEGTSDTLSSTNGGGSVWPGPATHAGSEVRGPVLPSATGRWVKVADVTILSKPWWPADIGGTGGTTGDAMLGLVLAQDNDDWTSTPSYTSTADNVEFASDDWGSGATKALELRFTFDDNSPPLTPTVLSPEPSGGGAAVQVATTSGTELTVTFDFNDADDATCATVELEVYPNAITDATASAANRTRTTGAIAPTGTGTARRYTVRLTGIPARTDQRHRLRVRDPKGAWSPWTSLAEGRIQTAYVPGVPLQPVMQTTPDSPHVFGTINNPVTGPYHDTTNPGGDYITGWEGEFYRDNPDGSTTTLGAWSKAIGGTSTRSDAEWAGEVQLQGGDRVRWRHRHANRDGVVGAWSPFYTTTIQTQIGPTVTPGDTSTKLLARTGPITIAAASFDGYRYRLYRGEALIHDSGVVSVAATTSTAVTLPEGVIGWGDTIGIEAAVRPATSGVVGSFAPRSFFYVDALPSTTITASDGEGGTGATVPTTDILWAIPYLDPDVGNHGETPSAQELEIRVAATPAGSGALVDRRTSVGGISQDLRTGRRLHALTATTGWVPDADVSISTYSATNFPSYTGNNLAIVAAASAVDRGARYTFPTPLDLSRFSGGSLLRIVRRTTSTTGLVRWTLRLETSPTAYREYTIVGSGDPVDTWGERTQAIGEPLATVGAFDLASVASILLFADVSASYAGSLYVRDLRIGTVQFDHSPPAGHIAPEASYDARARYRDDATPKMSTTLAASSSALATNVKLTSVTGIAVGDWLTLVTTGLIESRLVTVVGTAGSGGTGVTVSEAYAYPHTSAEAAVVHHWGPWTPYLTVKASLPPTVAADTPADLALLTDPTPALVHTFSSPGGKAQASRTTRVLRRRGYAARVAAMAPASWWRLSETSGTFADQVGGITGTAGGTMTRGVTGALDPSDTDAAVDLDGASGYITTGDAHDFPALAAMSVAAWVRSDGQGGNDHVLSKGGVTDGWMLRVHADGSAGFYRGHTSLFDQVVAPAASIPTDGTWAHLVATFDGTTMQLYVDGVAVSAGTASSKSLPGNASALTIGRVSSAAAGWFDGRIDEPAIWSRALSAAEVAALHGARLEVPGDEPLHTLEATGAGLTDTLPILLLETGRAYAWQKTARDTDGLSGSTTTRAFTTGFAQPDPVADLVATSDPDAGTITLTWTPSTAPHLAFYVVRWRGPDEQMRRIDAGPRVLDDGRVPLTAATFTWDGGRLGDNQFEVTVHDGSIESEATTVEATLLCPGPGRWMFVLQDEARYTFTFDPDDAPRVQTGSVETIRPPGRPYPIHLHWGTGGRRVSLRITYLPEELDLALVLGELLASGRALWVKAPEDYRWDRLRVRVVALSDDPRQGGLMQVSVDLDEVDPDA